MKVRDERKNAYIYWNETVAGEIYEFTVPSYQDTPFLGMVLDSDSFNCDPDDKSPILVDLETGHGFILYDAIDIYSIKKLDTELVIKKTPTN